MAKATLPQPQQLTPTTINKRIESSHEKSEKANERHINNNCMSSNKAEQSKAEQQRRKAEQRRSVAKRSAAAQEAIERDCCVQRRVHSGYTGYTWVHCEK